MTQTLIPFADNLWLCEGPTITGTAGFHFPTRMVVIRLENRDLWIWSPVTPSAEIMVEITKPGPVDIHHTPSARDVFCSVQGIWRA